MRKLVFLIIFNFHLLVFASEEMVAQDSSSIVAAPVAENQIPVNVDQVKAPTEATSTTGKLMLTGIVVSLMLLTAYYFVRKYKTSNKINKSSMQIKVLTQHYLGPKKSLAIIRVAGESMLIGVTDSNISMIKSLSLLDEELPTAEMPQNFVESLDAKNSVATAQQPEELEEEFSFSAVKDTVSKKLKSMRSLS